ncbi:MAG: transglutaminase-like cysteine peptidase [Xanthobacteraceae bacterium]
MVQLPRKTIAVRHAAILALPIFLGFFVGNSPAGAAAIYEPVGQHTSAPPIGWVQFCQTYSQVCDTKPLPAVDVLLDRTALSELKRVNDWVNHTIRPETDMDHYGTIQWWRYPDDGAGACHSYALLKRRILMQAGWPRQALLMTIVHEADGEGHAVLTVATDRGEFILDNLSDNILLWSQTPYRYYKRQSQDDPNVWVWLDDTRENVATSSKAAP